MLPVRFAGIHVYGDVADGVCAIGSLTTTDNPDRLVGQVMLTRSQTVSHCWTSTKSTWRCCGSRGGETELSQPLFTLEWEPAPLDKPAGEAVAVLIVGERTDADPLLGPAIGAARQDQALRAGSARRRQSLRAAITRSGADGTASSCVCPPRSIDESRPEQTQLDLAQPPHAAHCRHRQDGVPHGRPKQPAAVDRHARCPAA